MLSFLLLAALAPGQRAQAQTGRSLDWSGSGAGFSETSANDGALTGGFVVGLTGDTWATTNTATMAAAITVNNLPAGLSVEITSIVSAGTIQVAQGRLTGKADSHADVNDTSVTFSFSDAAFTSGDASNVANSTSPAYGIDFDDPAPSDTTAPTLSTAEVDGTTLVLNYNEPLDTGSVPAAAQFTVTVASANRNVTGVSVNGSAVTLTLASPVANGETVTVSYAVPGTNPIQDTAGNDAAAFNNRAVTNNTADNTAPTLSTATVDGTTLVLTYNEPLDTGSVPAAAQFTATVASANRNVTAVAVNGSAVTLTLASAVANGETVELTYAVPGTNPIQDTAGNDAAALNNQAVTNNTADNTAPTLSTATVDGTTLVLTYNEPLDTGSVPAVGQFTATVASANRNVTTVAVNGSAVTLTLASAVANGETVTVTYAVPGTNPIQDTAGNDAAPLNNQAVTNNTADNTAPTLSTATVDGATLTLTYNEPLDTGSVPAVGQFTATVASASRNVTGVAVNGSAVTLTLASAVANGETVTVTYAVPGTKPIQDAAGNDAAAFNNRAVTNKTAAPQTSAMPAPPAAITDATNSGANTDTITNNTTIEVTGTAVADALVELTASATRSGATYTVTVTHQLSSGATSYSISLDLTTARDGDTTIGAALRDGDWTVTARQTESGKTISTASTGLTVTLDTTAPVLTYGPAPSSLTVGTAITAMTPTAYTDANKMATGGISVKSGSPLPPGLTPNADTGVIGGAPTTVNGNIRDTVIIATDLAGNTTETTITFPMVNAADNTAPTLSTAEVDGDTLVLTYNEVLDTGSVPAPGDFGVFSGDGLDITPLPVATGGVARRDGGDGLHTRHQSHPGRRRQRRRGADQPGRD